MQRYYSFRENCGNLLHLFCVPNLMRGKHLETLAEIERAKKGMGHVIFS